MGGIVNPSSGPAFSAYRSTDQTPSPATWTKLTANTKEFDTNGAYDNATNYRFAPTAAGYYQCSAGIMTGGGGGVGIALYKNGTEFKRGANVGLPSGALNISFTTMTVSALVYFNGTTDYVEVYGYNSAGSVFVGGASTTYFQSSMIRGA